MVSCGFATCNLLGKTKANLKVAAECRWGRYLCIYLNVLAKTFQSEGEWLVFFVWQLPPDTVFPFTTAVSGTARDAPLVSGNLTNLPGDAV